MLVQGQAQEVPSLPKEEILVQGQAPAVPSPPGAIARSTKTREPAESPVNSLQTAAPLYEQLVGIKQKDEPLMSDEGMVQILSDTGEWIPYNPVANPPYFAKGGDVNETIFDRYINKVNYTSVEQLAIKNIGTVELPDNIFAYELLIENIDITKQPYKPFYFVGNIRQITEINPEYAIFAIPAIKAMLMYVYIYNVIYNNKSEQQYTTLLSTYKESAIRSAEIIKCMYVPATCNLELTSLIRTELLFKINELYELMKITPDNNNQNNNNNPFTIPAKIARINYLANFILKCDQFNRYFKRTVINIKEYIKDDAAALEKLSDINAFIKPRIENNKFVFNKVKTGNILGLYTPRSKEEPSKAISILEDLSGLTFEQENNNSSSLGSNMPNELNINLKGPPPTFENRGPQNNESNFEPYNINVRAPLNTINEGNENAANNNGPPAAPETEERPVNLPSAINPFNMPEFKQNALPAMKTQFNNMPETANVPEPVAAAPPYNPFNGGKRSANKRRRTLARK
jgi:hypothetical protein